MLQAIPDLGLQEAVSYCFTIKSSFAAVYGDRDERGVTTIASWLASSASCWLEMVTDSKNDA